MVRRDAWNDFNFFEFIKFRFMAQDVIYPREGSVSTWEKGEIHISGHPHSPAPSILYPASDIDWQFVSYMIVYMFQCHSPKSSHPLPLPQSPKVRYTHLCLFCCLAYRVIITTFLNSIYMCQYTVLVFSFLACFTLYNRL